MRLIDQVLPYVGFVSNKCCIYLICFLSWCSWRKKEEEEMGNEELKETRCVRNNPLPPSLSHPPPPPPPLLPLPPPYLGKLSQEVYE